VVSIFTRASWAAWIIEKAAVAGSLASPPRVPYEQNLWVGGSSHQGSRPRSFSSWSLDHIARVSFRFGLFGPQRWTLSAHDEISDSSESTY
jgi:hypothetical protein